MTDRVAGHAMVGPADSEFRVCVASVEEMLEIQRESERAGWATRWSSSQAILEQIGANGAYICPLIRERRNAEGAATRYRCRVLYRRADQSGTGAVVTLDIATETLAALQSLEISEDVKVAFYDIFALAMNGIDMSSKD